ADLLSLKNTGIELNYRSSLRFHSRISRFSVSKFTVCSIGAKRANSIAHFISRKSASILICEAQTPRKTDQAHPLCEVHPTFATSLQFLKKHLGARMTRQRNSARARFYILIV